MKRAIHIPSLVGTDVDSRIEHLIDLIDELIAVVDKENRWLSQGLPASRSRQIARKTELAECFEIWVEEVSSRKMLVQTGNEKLRATFIERMKLLTIAMDENILRLRAAIEASKRRIEAVMSAIREQVADANPYNSSGRLSARSASFGTNVRA